MHVWLPNKWVYFFNGCCNDSIVIDSLKNIKTINVLFTFGESQDFIHLYIGIKNTRQSLFVLYAIFICSVNDGITYGPLKETWKLIIHIIIIFWRLYVNGYTHGWKVTVLLKLVIISQDIFSGNTLIHFTSFNIFWLLASSRSKTGFTKMSTQTRMIMPFISVDQLVVCIKTSTVL